MTHPPPPQTADRHSLESDAHAVLLPVVLSPSLDQASAGLITSGCRTLLIGETRREYLDRRMSDDRVSLETPEQFAALAERIHALVGGEFLIAVDQELGGIQRLHRLVAPLPSRQQAHQLGEAALTESVQLVADDMRGIGINLTLAPVLDVVRGLNPHLVGRSLGGNPADIARVGRAFVRGMQAAGVAATAKHFPGQGLSETDPHTSPTRIRASREELEEHLEPFRAAVEVGVEAVMLGPAVMEGVDPGLAASLSPRVVSLLREDLSFRGVIVSDDLDSRSIAEDRSVRETAVLAINAGVDLLLAGLSPKAVEMAGILVDAVEQGRVPRQRLAEAAGRVRALAGKYR
jgi:beta-N-acetylhexosaminidase